MAYVLGIDIGTYESKGVLVDRFGKIIVTKSVPHKMEVPKPGWAEHDAENVWWNDFKVLSSTIVNDAKSNFGISPAEILAVGVSSIGPAVVPIDQNGRPLRKAILYGVDTRAQEEIQLLNAEIGEDAIFDNSGQVLSAQSAGPKILWIKRNEPEVYEKTYKFLCGSGYVVYKLTNELIIDRYTAASYSPLFHIHDLTWNQDTVSNITEIDKLPELVWSNEIVGHVNEKAAEETGLVKGTKVIAGTVDALSESISIGSIHPGDLMLMYGSSTFFINVSDSFQKTKKFWPNIHSMEGLYTVTGGTSTAGSLTRWYVDELMLQFMNKEESKNVNMSELYTYITQEAEKSPVGANGLITLPYFSGERTPIHHASAKGMMFGLTLRHTSADIYRSIVEGIAFSIRHNIDEMKKLNTSINRILIVGGGVKSKLWVQSVSDICQIKQIVPKTIVGASYGNAFLCALALGWYSKLEDIDEWVEIAYEVEPLKENYEALERNYEIYRELYENTKKLMDNL
ncbi:xylulokinase [Bacillus oleivorans]|uniref:Xylulokinase n=1 Tax=Bacillus oleivorans TaxID=1448271 RepID=A0A285CPB3_9BACI|nr:FGGY-family carbohydrate kinase [Bacillus oleivorans]SNX69420.1 xylulokinase [Bacillus oleivorans]